MVYWLTRLLEPDQKFPAKITTGSNKKDCFQLHNAVFLLLSTVLLYSSLRYSYCILYMYILFVELMLGKKLSLMNHKNSPLFPWDNTRSTPDKLYCTVQCVQKGGPILSNAYNCSIARLWIANETLLKRLFPQISIFLILNFLEVWVCGPKE